MEIDTPKEPLDAALDEGTPPNTTDAVTSADTDRMVANAADASTVKVLTSESYYLSGLEIHKVLLVLETQTDGCVADHPLFTSVANAADA